MGVVAGKLRGNIVVYPPASLLLVENEHGRGSMYPALVRLPRNCFNAQNPSTQILGAGDLSGISDRGCLRSLSLGLRISNIPQLDKPHLESRAKSAPDAKLRNSGY